MYKIKGIYEGYILWAGLLVLLVMGCNVPDNDAGAIIVKATPTLSTYGSLLDSEVRGIDPATIDGYLTGKGLGLALPAELNGYPGPRHVLDLADDLALSGEQTEQIQVLFDEMQSQAIELGEQFLTEEAKLEEAFREQTIDDNFLQEQLKIISDLQAQLRYVHLRTHLATIHILSAHQIATYNQLRGYNEMPADHQHNQHHN